MDWILWDDTLNTGQARMDADHKELADLFNLLRDAADGGKGKASCARILDHIIQHARTHFDLEQRLMVQHRYPQVRQHSAEHAMLIDQAVRYKAAFERDAGGSRIALSRFPEVWLAFHILFSDKALADFLARSV